MNLIGTKDDEKYKIIAHYLRWKLHNLFDEIKISTLETRLYKWTKFERVSGRCTVTRKVCNISSKVHGDIAEEQREEIVLPRTREKEGGVEKSQKSKGQ